MKRILIGRGNTGVLKMRRNIFMAFALAVSIAQSHGAQENVPPVSGKTEATNSSKDNTQKQHSITINPPSSINATVGKKLDVKSEPDKTGRHEEPTHYADWAVAFFSFCLVLVTGYLVHYTKKLWRSTTELVGDAKTTAERQLRAYVGISETKQGMRVESDDDKREMVAWFINVHWRNNGQTPARNMVGWISCGFFEPDIPKDYDFPKPKSAQNSISAIGRDSVVKSGDINISKEYIAKLISGTGKLYVWGRADYDDVFKGTPRRHTTFCYQAVIARIDDFTNPEGLPFEFDTHDQHNGES